MSLTNEHNQLHNQIWNCSCMPLNQDYCKDCQKAVITFMNTYGAGNLTRDILVENLQKEISVKGKEIDSLKLRLQEKIIRVDELKEELKASK